MPNPSKLKRMPKQAQEAFFALVREGRSIDDIVAHLKSMGEAHPRSTVGDWAKSARSQMERYSQAQEIAKVWIGKLDTDPQGDVGRLLAEMLRTVAFQQISQMGEEGAEVGSEELMFVAKAIKDLASADKTSADREIKIRDSVMKKAASNMEQAARAEGMGEDQIALWRDKFLLGK